MNSLIPNLQKSLCVETDDCLCPPAVSSVCSNVCISPRVGVHRLSDEKMETLFSALSTVQTLAEVQLALDSLTERGAASLIHLIQNCGQLQVLRITVKGRDDSYMSATLSTPGRLKEDVLLGCEDVNVSEIILLCGGLRDSGVIIKDLELECHNVNVYEKILLCGELRERGVIVKDLQWSLTGLTDTCLDDLCSASSIQQTVTRLQLGHNELTDASIPVLNCFIQKCNNLHHFQVVVCRLPDEKLEDLCFALSTLQALSKAELTLNNLTERCATSLMHLIQSCGRLQKLRVSCGLLLEPGIRVLRESQRRPDCSLIIDGWRCNKPSDQCLDLELCNQTCNSHVCLKILGTSFIEEPYGGGKGCRKQRYLYTSEPAAE
ncbi:NACHT, LRR and PYD domains-containing protein 3 [Amia ocellicauda]|uniref:NACHT, LRR and PYD domains-containing protein 3 n=1 Tax=Amia ocellicauda TaxID=2972642 RepID=UPI0034644841